MTQETEKTLDALEEQLTAQYQFRKNTVTSKTEFRHAKGKQPFRPMEDYTLNSMRRELKANGISVSKSEISGLLNSHFVLKVDVFQEYFTSLKLGTAKGSYIDRLADTVTTTNHTYWKKCLRKWLVGVVACAITPEVVNHQVLILVGAQGLGKTTWLHKLLPVALHGYMYSGHISPNNKDTLIMLTENLLVNLDELGSFKASDIDSLKELITKSNIQFRRPYGVYMENYIRRASLMGSVNNVSFLTDHTGNRRFLPFTVTNIDHNHKVNMDHVYGEAYQLYLQGFQYWFEGADIAEIEAHNEQYIDHSMEHELVEKFFTPAGKGEKAILYTATDICRLLAAAKVVNMNTATVQKIGAALRSLGFLRVKKDGRYKYAIKKPQEEIKQEAYPTYPNNIDKTENKAA